MPDKPLWSGRLDEIITELNLLPWAWIDRETLQSILRIGPRRAQQILRPCAEKQIGASLVANRENLIAHLRRLGNGDQAHYERRRRWKLAQRLNELRQSALAQPKVLVEAPVAVVGQQFANLPDGVTVSPGAILISFSSPSEALQRLLALAMAIGNDFTEFEHLAGLESDAGPSTTTGVK